MNTPKGYVALTRRYDGKPIMLDARGLNVSTKIGADEECVVSSANYDDNGWVVAESFDEVCAKLAAALGEQTPPAAPALHDLIERAHLFATFCACESGDVQSRAKAWLADYDKAKVSL